MENREETHPQPTLNTKLAGSDGEIASWSQESRKYKHFWKLQIIIQSSKLSKHRVVAVIAGVGASLANGNIHDIGTTWLTAKCVKLPKLDMLGGPSKLAKHRVVPMIVVVVQVWETWHMQEMSTKKHPKHCRLCKYFSTPKQENLKLARVWSCQLVP